MKVEEGQGKEDGPCWPRSGCRPSLPRRRGHGKHPAPGTRGTKLHSDARTARVSSSAFASAGAAGRSTCGGHGCRCERADQAARLNELDNVPLN